MFHLRDRVIVIIVIKEKSLVMLFSDYPMYENNLYEFGQACLREDVEFAKQMISKGSFGVPEFNNGLAIACCFRRTEMIIFLLSLGACDFRLLDCYFIKSEKLCEWGLPFDILVKFDRLFSEKIVAFRKCTAGVCKKFVIPELVQIIKDYCLV